MAFDIFARGVPSFIYRNENCSDGDVFTLGNASLTAGRRRNARSRLSMNGIRSIARGQAAHLLGTNLGPSPGANHDAHHMVMTGTKDPKMNSLVEQMKTHGIDPDGKQNGIWLARTDNDKIPGISPNTSHKQDGLHGNAYKEELFDRLNGKNKKDFKKELGKIKKELKAGRTWDTATPKKLGKACR